MPWMRMARTASEGERLATQILAGLEIPRRKTYRITTGNGKSIISVHISV